MTAYLERLPGHPRPGPRVQGIASELAHFGRFLARHDPGLASLALLDRQRHIEPYLNEVAAAVNHRTGAPIAASTAKAADPDRRAASWTTSPSGAGPRPRPGG